MQTKWYGKSRNGVSFDRLACNRQKEALFLMPYYWDMKGWRATVSCRLDCAIKMELRVVAIKVSRCQHGKQRKVLGSIVLKHFKAYRQGFFLPCHSRRKLVWGTRTVFLRRRLTFIQECANNKAHKKNSIEERTSTESQKYRIKMQKNRFFCWYYNKVLYLCTQKRRSDDLVKICSFMLLAGF